MNPNEQTVKIEVESETTFDLTYEQNEYMMYEAMNLMNEIRKEGWL